MARYASGSHSDYVCTQRSRSCRDSLVAAHEGAVIVDAPVTPNAITHNTHNTHSCSCSCSHSLVAAHEGAVAVDAPLAQRRQAVGARVLQKFAVQQLIVQCPLADEVSSWLFSPASCR